MHWVSLNIVRRSCLPLHEIRRRLVVQESLRLVLSFVALWVPMRSCAGLTVPFISSRPGVKYGVKSPKLFGLHVHSSYSIRGRYWSAEIDDISLWPPALPGAPPRAGSLAPSYNLITNKILCDSLFDCRAFCAAPVKCSIINQCSPRKMSRRKKDKKYKNN